MHIDQIDRYKTCIDKIISTAIQENYKNNVRATSENITVKYIYPNISEGDTIR